jgi:enoyl-CoA hydratase/carnithine racemase
VRSERDEEVVTLWLDRPERGNALGPDLVEALEREFGQAVATGARLIVLRGSGRHFCTGLDLSDLDAISDGDLALRVIRIEILLQAIHAAPVTTLAVGNGRIFGAGADLFAVCDHRIATEEARFSFPGPAFGLVLGTGRLAGLVGDCTARALLLKGKVLDARTALSIGLATEVLPPESVAAALEAARHDATRLDAETVAMLHRRTRRADDAADLAALARSVARPGLKERVQRYRARVLAERGTG